MQAKGERIYLIKRRRRYHQTRFSITHNKLKEAGVIFSLVWPGRWLHMGVREEGATPTFFFHLFFFSSTRQERIARTDWLLAGSRRRPLVLWTTPSHLILSQPGTCLMFVSGMQAMGPVSSPLFSKKPAAFILLVLLLGPAGAPLWYRSYM